MANHSLQGAASRWVQLTLVFLVCSCAGTPSFPDEDWVYQEQPKQTIMDVYRELGIVDPLLGVWEFNPEVPRSRFLLDRQIEITYRGLYYANGEQADRDNAKIEWTVGQKWESSSFLSDFRTTFRLAYDPVDGLTGTATTIYEQDSRERTHIDEVELVRRARE